MDTDDFKNKFRKRLINFSIQTIYLCENIRKNRNLYSIADQLIRSSTSIGANVTEAKPSSSKKDFIRYFEIALKSANETIYWFEVLFEIYSEKSLIKKMKNEVEEISKIIATGILTMKGKR